MDFYSTFGNRLLYLLRILKTIEYTSKTYNDRWWSYNWNDTDIIYFSAYLEKGWHTIEILAFKGCCDGGQSLQFKSPSDSTWKTCKYTSPEPTVIIGSEEVP